MHTHAREPAQNLLVAALPSRDRRHLLARCERVDLAAAEVLHEAGEPIRGVFFPTSSTISLVTPSFGRNGMQVGLVGDEGMLGTSLVLGVAVAPMIAHVQGPGAAWRMDTEPFRLELEHSAALQLGLQRYIHVVMSQLAQMAVCTRFHVVEARLARWLLMTRDRTDSVDLHVTHERLAHILGVRRAGVTRAAGALQARQLVRYCSGHVTILDRRGLEAAACGCYAIDRKTYATAMNRSRDRRPRSQEP